jgi:cation:H+ antiporter
MIWLSFFGSLIILVLAATKLAEYGDALAVRTGVGRLFVGTLLMAAATSLPELLTGINSMRQGVADLSAGNFFGSNMFNIFLLGFLDLIFWRVRVLRQVALKHVFTAGVAILMTTLAIFFVEADLHVRVGWVELDSLILIAGYVVGVWLIRRNDEPAAIPDEAPDLTGVPSLLVAVIGFVLSAAVLIWISPRLVRSSVGVAEITGLSKGFVGAAMVGVATSLPELVTTIAAIKIGAYDMAVGNLLGSNLFNMAALGLTDLFYTRGYFLESIDIQFSLVGLISIILMSLALIGNATRGRFRRLVVEADAAAIILVYALGMYFLYTRGIGG